MKKFYSLLFAAMSTAAMAQPMITGFVDGPCTGGHPKLLEITAVGTVDMSAYTLQNQTNSNTNWGAPFDLSVFGTLNNESVYLVYGTSAEQGPIFSAEFPSIPASKVVYTGAVGTININGDDRLRIIETVSTNVVDIFGEDGVDGTETEWEYLDGYFIRNAGSTPSATFNINEWTFSGVDFTDGKGACNSQEPLENSVPFGQFLSVAQNSIAGLSVYPNPVSGGNLFITSAANEAKDVVVYNIIGKQVAAARVENGAMNIANLTAGVYIVKITEAGKTATRKLVVK